VLTGVHSLPVAKLSRRLGRLGVDWRAAEGRRRWVTVKSEAEGYQKLARILHEAGKPHRVDAGITLSEYSAQWEAVTAVRVQPNSLLRYRWLLRRHILPALGLHGVRDLTTPQLRGWLASKAQSGVARSTVGSLQATLHSIFRMAVRDGLCERNPLEGVARELGLQSKVSKVEAVSVRILTAEQLGRFLTTARADSPDLYPVFYALAMTGLRLGEALGLKWEDVDADGGLLRVERQVHEDGRVTPPKTTKSRRTVGVPGGLLTVLAQHRAERRVADLKTLGRPSVWVAFPWPDRGPDPKKAHAARVMLRYRMTRILRTAGLSESLSPHAFRHTFATLLLARGESPKYVQEQLGHESIQMTVDLYGRWMPTRSDKAAEALEREVMG
jgi:integrase